MVDYKTTYGESHLLAIGINSYHDPRFVPLGQAEADATSMAELLSKPPFGFGVETLQGAQATRQAILAALYRLRRATPDDRIVVYFAGHGYTLADNFGQETGYLACADTVPEEDFTALELAQITGLRRQSHAKHITFIFDACFSGQALGLTRAASVSADKYLLRRAYQIISAGAGDQTVSDFHSMTRHIIELLASDYTDSQGLLTANALGLAVQQRVAAESGQMQIPQFGHLQGSQGGDLVFRHAGEGLPYQVIEALESSSKYIRIGALSELASLIGSDDAETSRLALDQLNRLATGDPDLQIRTAAQTYLDQIAQRAPQITATLMNARKQLSDGEVTAPELPTDDHIHPASKLRRTWLVVAAGVIALILLIGGLALSGVLNRLLMALTPQRSYAASTQVSAALGMVNSDEGLTQYDNTDGITQSVTIGGESARKSIPEAPSNYSYFYFFVDDSFIDGTASRVKVTIDYFDKGTFCFQLEYDSADTEEPMSSNGHYKQTAKTCLKNSGQWKTTTYNLPDAYFDGNQNGGADFRISNNGNFILYVKQVVVIKQ